MTHPYADAPEIPILLLGDSGVGKSTFLSRLTLGTANHNIAIKALPTPRDLDQPFPFHIRLFNRPYIFTFSDTASPTHYTLLRPSVIILCYSIASPESLESVKRNWKVVVESRFSYDESLPVILLGLGRDVRREEDYDGRVRTGRHADDGDGDLGEGLVERRVVYPQEALRVAQEMRCDRYCECSAWTGDLCFEVFEDIARTAALTTTAKGGKTEGSQCLLM